MNTDSDRTSLFTCWAKHSFKQSSPEDLEFTVGDEIKVIETDKNYNDGWYYGRNTKTGLTGIFPMVYVTISRDAESTEVVDWSSDQVSEWIGSLNLPDASKVQERWKWDGVALMDLHMIKLEELGLFSIRSRIKLLQAIVALKAGAEGSTSGPLSVSSGQISKSSESNGPRRKSFKRDSSESRPSTPEISFKQVEILLEDETQILTPESIPPPSLNNPTDKYLNAGELTSANEVEILIKEDLANFKRNQVIFEHPTTDFIPATIADHGKSLLKTSGEKLADDQSGAIVEDQSVTHYRNRSCATNYSSFTVSDYFVAPPPPSSFPFENLVIPKKQTETFPKVDNAEPVTFSEVYSDMHISSHSEMSDYKPNQDLPNNHQLSATETFTLSMEELKRSSPSPFSSPARSRNASIVETLKKNLTRNPSISPKSSSSLDDTNSIREIFLNRFGATKPNTVEKGSSASSLDPSHRQSEELVTRLDFVPKTKKVQMTLSELISKTFSKLHIPWNRDRNRNRDSKSFVSLTGSLPRFGSEREVKRSASVPEMSPERSVVETLTKRLSTMSSQSGMVDMDEATQSGWLHVKKDGKGDWHKRYAALIGPVLYLFKSETSLNPIVDFNIDFKSGVEPSRESRPFAFQYCNQDKSVFYHFAPGTQLEMIKWIDSMVRCQETRRKGRLIPIKTARPIPRTISEQLRNPTPNGMLVTTLVENRSDRISYGNPKFMPDRPFRSSRE